MIDQAKQASDKETGVPHQVEVTPAMIEAGLEALMSGFPDCASGHNGWVVEAIFKAMYAARFSEATVPQGPVLVVEQR